MKNAEWVKEGEGVRRVREGMGLSRSQLAARLGLKEPTLKCVENGSQRMGARTFRSLEQLARTFQGELCAQRRPVTVEVMEDQGGGYMLRPPEEGNHEVGRVVRQALASARDDKVRLAAQALAEALGQTYEEALAVVIEQRLKHG